MLAGELPWERASEQEPRYVAWCASVGTGSAASVRGVWRKVSLGALALLRGALHPAPTARPALDSLLKHGWLQSHTPAVHADTTRVWCSQPAPVTALTGDTVDAAREGGASEGAELSPADMDALISYSQPALADDMLLSTQNENTQMTQQSMSARLVRRMTRVWVRAGDEAAALQALVDVLRDKRYSWRRLHPRILAIDCGDEVRMRAWAVRVRGAGETAEEAGRVVLEFRRSRGCGLAFKRRYVELRDALRPLATDPPPYTDLFAAPLALEQHEPMDDS